MAHRGAWVVLGATAATAVAVMGASLEIRAASAVERDCLVRGRDGYEHDPIGCVDRARARARWIERTLPWLRGVRVAGSDAEPNELALVALDETTAGHPDRLRRERAARWTGRYAASEADRPMSPFSKGSDCGVGAPLVESAAVDLPLQFFIDAFWTEAARGADDLVARLGARLPAIVERDTSAEMMQGFHCHLREAAWLCLHGHEEAGRKLFASSRCCDGWSCNPELEALREYGAGLCAEGSDSTSGTGRAASALLGLEFRDVFVDADFRDPWLVPSAFCGSTGGNDGPVPACSLDPDALVQEAEATEALEPSQAARGAIVADAVARRAPDALRTLAAVEWLHRGRSDAARRELANVPAMPRGGDLHDAFRALRVGWFADDPRGVATRVAAIRRELDAGLLGTGHDAATRSAVASLLHVYEALSLDALGDTAAAASAAQAALRDASRLTKDDWSRTGLCGQMCMYVPTDTPGPTDAPSVRLSWLAAALALRSGSFDGLDRTLLAPEVVDLIRRLRGSAAARRSARLNYEYAGWLAVDATTSSRMFVVGALAAGEGDVEVWLDRAFAPLMREGARAAMRARADAARMRGDRAAELRWRDAAQRASDRIVDSRTAILARIARH